MFNNIFNIQDFTKNLTLKEIWEGVNYAENNYPRNIIKLLLETYNLPSLKIIDAIKKGKFKNHFLKKDLSRVINKNQKFKPSLMVQDFVNSGLIEFKIIAFFFFIYFNIPSFTTHS